MQYQKRSNLKSQKNRRFDVQINKLSYVLESSREKYTEITKIRAEMVHGSILCFLLYIFYTADILSFAGNKKIATFADGIYILSVGDKINL